MVRLLNRRDTKISDVESYLNPNNVQNRDDCAHPDLDTVCNHKDDAQPGIIHSCHKYSEWFTVS